MARPFVIGTAGHVDHGKSALVQALTGIDPDRLPEEKRRGMTLELGFAHGELALGVGAAFVDVPGHERFVRAMVAGAQGVDVVLFVVAADEGVRPQTREHADIVRLLGATRVVVALTKADLLPGLEAGWPALVAEEIHALGGPLAEAPIVPVSARTGEGLEGLKAVLVLAARDLPPRPAQVPALLPIDRAFTLKGHGTIVTGTLVAGALEAGEGAELVAPAPREARITGGLRVRTLQTHGRVAARAQAGQRVAVNLPDVEVADIPRGSALVHEGTGRLRSGALLDVELEVVVGAPTLASRARLTLHLGTAQAIATVDLLGRASVGPGDCVVAQLRLDRAIAAARDLRFVLRGYRSLASGGRTVGGGRVLLVGERRRRAADRPLVEALRGDVVEAARSLVAAKGTRGYDTRELVAALGAPAGLAAQAGFAVLGERSFVPSVLPPVVERLRDLVRTQPGVPREQARGLMGAGVAAEAFTYAVGALGPAFVTGDTLTLAGAAPSRLEQDVGRVLDEAGLEAPTVGALAVRLGVDKGAVGGAVRALAKGGRAVRLTDELFVARGAADAFRARVVTALEARGGLTTLELKELAGTSRKYAIPLCEWLDREHVTLRVGDRRTLRRAGRA